MRARALAIMQGSTGKSRHVGYISAWRGWVTLPIQPHLPWNDDWQTATWGKLLATRQISREGIAGPRNPWGAENSLEITIRNQKPPNARIKPLLSINDEIDWDKQYRRSIDALNRELLDIVCGAGRFDDSEIGRIPAIVAE
jgi:hypothetical protein